MAKAPAKPEAVEGDAPAPKKSKKMLILVIVLAILLLVVGGGAAFLLLSKNKHADEGQAADAHEPEPPKVTIDKGHPPVFVPLDAFTVNLQRESGDHFLQAVIVLRVSDAKVGEELKLYMPEIRHRVNLLLSSKLPSEISNIEGREALAEEIMIEANDVLGYEPPRRQRGSASEPWGPVLSVLFNSFIIQ